MAGFDSETLRTVSCQYNEIDKLGGIASGVDSRICNLVANINPLLIGGFVMMINTVRN
jgi:hypothetical protein